MKCFYHNVHSGRGGDTEDSSMDDLKEILMFIGFAMGKFFTNLVLYAGLLLVAVILTTAVFLIGIRNFHSNYMFAAFLAVLAIAVLFLRRLLVLKNQTVMNMMFIRFLSDREDVTAQTLIEELPDIRQPLRQAHEFAKENNIRPVPAKLQAALAAIFALSKEKEMSNGQRFAQVRRLTLGYLLLQLGIFLLILLPFILITFLFSGYMTGPSSLLIYVLGVYFVYFLNAAIIDPILSLILQKRLYSLF